MWPPCSFWRFEKRRAATQGCPYVHNGKANGVLRGGCGDPPRKHPKLIRPSKNTVQPRRAVSMMVPAMGAHAGALPTERQA